MSHAIARAVTFLILLLVSLIVRLIAGRSGRAGVEPELVERWKAEVLAYAARIDACAATGDFLPLCIPVSIPLEENEGGFLEERGVELSEPRMSRVYAGGRIWKGVYIGASDPVELRRHIDTGTLTMTTRRLVFVGDLESRTIALSSVVSAKPVAHSLEVATSGRGKINAFTVSNPLLWTTLVLSSKRGLELAAQEERAGHALKFSAAAHPVAATEQPWDDPSGGDQKRERLQKLKERLDEFRKNQQQRNQYSPESLPKSESWASPSSGKSGDETVRPNAPGPEGLEVPANRLEARRRQSRVPPLVVTLVAAAFVLVGTETYMLSRRSANDVPPAASSRASAPSSRVTPSPALPESAAVGTPSTAQPTSIPPQQQPTLQAAQPPEPPLPAEYHAGLNAAKDKDWLGAERAYRNALQKSPSKPDIWYKLGVVLGEQKRRPDAIGAYREAIRLNRDHVDSWYNLGLELSRQRDYRAALAAFREVTRLEPTNARGWKILGDLHIITKEYVQAVSALQEAVRLKPDDGDIWYDLGSVHVLANNRQDATKVYDRLKQLDPAKATRLKREGLDRMS